MPSPKLKLLFVCSVNHMRSATAHELYRHDQRFKVQSAGTMSLARRVLTRELLAWANVVVVMEKHHRQIIRQDFPEQYQRKKIVCLYIPDEYEFMQPELMARLKNRVEDVYRRGLLG